jgi:hypothetical protein
MEPRSAPGGWPERCSAGATHRNGYDCAIADLEQRLLPIGRLHGLNAASLTLMAAVSWQQLRSAPVDFPPLGLPYSPLGRCSDGGGITCGGSPAGLPPGSAMFT